MRTIQNTVLEYQGSVEKAISHDTEEPAEALAGPYLCGGRLLYVGRRSRNSRGMSKKAGEDEVL